MAEKEGFELVEIPTVFNQKLQDISAFAVFSDTIYYELTIINRP